ncbi:MAG: hypothetical protein ABJC61_00570, partial [Acidobacteriota bacterium]
MYLSAQGKQNRGNPILLLDRTGNRISGRNPFRLCLPAAKGRRMATDVIMPQMGESIAEGT